MNKYILEYTLERLENLAGHPQNEKEEKQLDFIMDLFWTRFSRVGGDNV